MKTWTTSSGYKIFRVVAGRSNVFLISGKGSDILVDTSPGFLWGKLQERLGALNISHIDLLILTHSHFDHAANASLVKEKYGAKVIIHSSEKVFLAAGDNILPTGTNLITKFMVRTFAKKFRSLARYSPCESDLVFDESFDLSEYRINGYIVHTPGHTAGSASVIIDNEVALVGDTLFGMFPGSVFPPFAADTDQLMRSWGKLLETGCNIFLPSHGSEDKRGLVERDYGRRKRL